MPTVIVGMEFARPHRIALSSLMAVTIALGGFYIGHAQTEVKTMQSTAAEPSFYGKVPPEFSIPVFRRHMAEIGITKAQLQKLEDATRPYLPEYFKQQKLNWEQRVKKAQLAEEGKFLSSTGDEIAGGYDELKAQEAMEKPLWLAMVKIEGQPYEVLGPKLRDKMYKYRGSGISRDDLPTYEILAEPGIEDTLQLSPAQRNQFVLFEAYFARETAKHTDLFHRKALYYDDVLPHREENRQVLAKASASLKGSFAYQIREHLSPMQRIKLEELVRNKTYVEL